MQLIINVKNKALAEEILNFLKSFENKGVKVVAYEEKEESLGDKEWDEKFIEEHWKDIVMNIHFSDLDDDERLYEAAARFYHEKHSD